MYLYTNVIFHFTAIPVIGVVVEAMLSLTINIKMCDSNCCLNEEKDLMSEWLKMYGSLFCLVNSLSLQNINNGVKGAAIKLFYLLIQSWWNQIFFKSKEKRLNCVMIILVEIINTCKQGKVFNRPWSIKILSKFRWILGILHLKKSQVSCNSKGW